MKKKGKCCCSVATFLLVLLLLLPVFSAFAEEADVAEEETTLGFNVDNRPEKTEPVHITVGNATKVSGGFFTAQFGNNTSDLDVRNMLHGYNPVYWANQEAYVTDPTVVDELEVTTANGNTVYTVHLFEDLLYNDGVTRVTAEDYVFSFLLQCSDEFNGLGAKPGTWGHLLGYDEYNAGQTDRLAALRLLDEKTFSVTVKKEYEPSFYELTYISTYPYPISVIAPGCKVVDSNEGAYIANIDETISEPLFTTELLASTVLGPDGYLHRPFLTTGPYRLVSYDEKSGVVEFEINEFYKGNWEGVTPYIDTVTLVEARRDTMMAQLANGEIDLLNKCVDGDVIRSGLTLTEDDNFRRSSYARLGYGFVGIACEKGPQQFQAVRQALACCLDKDSFVTDYLQGFGLTVDGCYGIGQWMYYSANDLLVAEDMDEKDQAKWKAVTLENLDHYAYDLDRALRLLMDDGWVYNSDGNDFDPEKDRIRCKKLKDGSLIPLSFQFAQCENNNGAKRVVDMLKPSLEKIGGELIVHVVPFTELLSDYYRENGRQYDLNFMATNFVSVFDPYLCFVKDERFEGSMNNSGIQDEELFKLAWNMHETEPMNELEYLQEWQLFQERFNEILPNIPLYSNMYFDFYTCALQNYNPGAEYDWPFALLYSYIDYTKPEKGTFDAEEDFDVSEEAFEEGDLEEFD